MSDSPFPPDKRDDDESRQATDGRARSLANLRPPWKPGETPNPEGRNGRVRIEEFRRWADDKATDKSELTRIQNVWNALYATAIDRKRGASHVNAGKIFVEQYQGKPTTPVEVTGKDGAPINSGVMMVPLFGSGTVEEWEQAARAKAKDGDD